MKRLYKISLTIIILAGLFSQLSFSQTKLAQTGFNFLSVSSDARSSGMGEAVTSLTGYSGALFFNPASMADIPKFFSSTFSINNWIADIKYLSASATLAPFSGDYGVIGLSVQSVDYGDVEGTIVADNMQGYIDTKIINPSAIAVGFGYAKMLSDKFSVGAQVRYVSQSLGENIIPDGALSTVKKNETDVIAFDFGTVYRIGIKSLAFGMSVRNFSKEIKYEQEGFQLPLIFAIGISANVFDFVEMPGPSQSLILSFDATHPRSHPEQVKIGIEYKFMEILSLRGGYISGNSEDDLTFGVGISSFGAEFDYAYTPFGVFDNVQRFTARISL